MPASENYEEDLDLEDAEDADFGEDAFEDAEYDDDDENFEYDDDDEGLELEDAEYDDDDEGLDLEDTEYDDDDEDAEYDDDDESFGLEDAEYDDDDEGFELEDAEYDDDDEGAFEDAEYDDDDEAAERRRRGRRRSYRRRMILRARARRRKRMRAARARQRRAAARARAAMKRMRARFRKIGKARRVKLRRVTRLRGSGVVTAQLPNGRRTRMRISPAPASIRSVNKLSARINANAKRQARVTSANAKALKRLSVAQSAAIKRLTAQQVKADKALSKRIVAGDLKLERRIAKELRGHNSAVARHRRTVTAAIKRQQRRSLMNNVLLATSLPLWSAYGDKSKPLGKNNVILALSTLGLLAADDVIDTLFVKKPRGALATATSVMSYLAPVGNAAVYAALRKTQERFVVGSATVSLEKGVGSQAVDFSDRNGFKKAPMRSLAMAVSDDGTATASTGSDKVTLNVTGADAAATSTTVVWLVDTQPTV